MLFMLLIFVNQLKKLTMMQKSKSKNKIFNHDDYITTNGFNKFSGTIIDGRLKVMKVASSCKHR